MNWGGPERPGNYWDWPTAIVFIIVAVVFLWVVGGGW